VSIAKIDVTEALQQAGRLLRQDRSLSTQARALFNLLIVIVNLLVAKLGLNSSNSSIPPSQDPHRERGSKRKGKGPKRKPGGQNGHEGATLQRDPNPDQIEDIPIDRRTIPPGRYKAAGFDSRQVIDIEIHKHVTEYRAEILEDAHGHRFVAQFPAGVTRPVQYGNRVKALSVYKSQQQLIPYERISDEFADQCGLPLSPGSVFNFNLEAFHLLATFEAIVIRQLILQTLLHADETGINVNGDGVWLPSLSNERWTLFFAHARRGAEAMIAMGVLPHFRGTLCHDHWKAYFQFTCQHVLCNAHHLRELKRAWQDDGHHWAENMRALLLEINEATTAVGGCLPEKPAEDFRGRYRSILIEGDRECPPPDPKEHAGRKGRQARTKSRNLLERLRDFETQTLRFMTDQQVPFTNNQGERDLRMTKVQQKISGCFRSFQGAQIFCRIRSYISTCKKHGLGATEALQILFSGHLPDFIPRLK